MHFYQPAQGHGLAHDPLNSIIAPRPIGWISSISAAGQVNLAPYSFFSGEFCWNLVSRPLAAAMNQTSATVPAEVNEFELAGLTMAASHLVRPPQVAESLVRFECKLSQLLPLKAADGRELPTWLVLGEVIGVHIAPQLLVNGVFDTLAADPLLRGGGPGEYFTLSASQKMTLLRPQV
ncbi:MAG: Asp/Glu/hydantoin racemase [Alishewanella sp. 34-51-39]|nr:MAG: Asp/Glu/hydantoin racemase [Alishewanella sp. 34-51-39]